MASVNQTLFNQINARLNSMLTRLDSDLANVVSAGGKFEVADIASLETLLKNIDESIVNDPRVKEIMITGELSDRKTIKSIINEVETRVSATLDKYKGSDEAGNPLISDSHEKAKLDFLYTNQVQESASVKIQQLLDKIEESPIEVGDEKRRYEKAKSWLELLQINLKKVELRESIGVKKEDDMLRYLSSAKYDVEHISYDSAAQTIPSGKECYKKLKKLYERANEAKGTKLHKAKQKKDMDDITSVIGNLKILGVYVPELDEVRKALEKVSPDSKNIDYAELEKVLRDIRDNKLQQNKFESAEAKAKKAVDPTQKAIVILRGVLEKNPIFKLFPEAKQNFFAELNAALTESEVKNIQENIKTFLEDESRKDEIKDIYKYTRSKIEQDLVTADKLLRSLHAYKPKDNAPGQINDITVFGKKITDIRTKYIDKDGNEQEKTVDFSRFETLPADEQTRIIDELVTYIAPYENGKIDFPASVNKAYKEGITGMVGYEPEGFLGFYRQLKFKREHGISIEDYNKKLLIRQEIQKAIVKAKEEREKAEIDAKKWGKVSPEVQEKLRNIEREAAEKLRRDVVQGKVSKDSFDEARRNKIKDARNAAQNIDMALEL